MNGDQKRNKFAFHSDVTPIEEESALHFKRYFFALLLSLTVSSGGILNSSVFPEPSMEALGKSFNPDFKLYRYKSLTLFSAKILSLSGQTVSSIMQLALMGPLYITCCKRDAKNLANDRRLITSLTVTVVLVVTLLRPGEYAAVLCSAANYATE